MKDVARYAGVSVSTVSRVVNGYPHVTDVVRERVQEAAAALGYRRNRMARGMRSGKSYSLGLIVRDMRSANFAEICAAAEEACYDAEENSYELFVCNSNRSATKERGYIESLLERKVDGLILFPADDRISNLDLLDDNYVPSVLVSSSLAHEFADRVDSCDEAASIAATRHLISLGHTRIAYLAWGQHIPSGSARLSGFRAAMASAGIELDRALVRFCGVDQRFAERETTFVLRRNPPPTALIASATDLLPGALAAIQSLQIEVPNDLSLIAFDDREVARFTSPPITVMKRNVADLGAKAVGLVLQRIANAKTPQQTIEVPFSLVTRQSTTRVSKHRNED